MVRPGSSETSGSFSTMNPVMPACGGSAPGSVFARSMTIPERQPFVTHIFWPVITYSFPSRTAAVRIAWTSEPACGSVIEKDERSSPDASLRRCRCFCSSVPWWRIIQLAMKVPFRIPDRVVQPRESSSTTSA